MERADHLFKDEENLGLSLNTGIKINREKSTISIDVHSQLKDKRNDNEVLVEHLGRTVYKIRGIEELYDEEKKEFEIPDDLIIHFFGIAYSHSCALLAVEVGPTVYQDNYMLPVVDPRRFFGKEGEVNSNGE